MSRRSAAVLSSVFWGRALLGVRRWGLLRAIAVVACLAMGGLGFGGLGFGVPATAQDNLAQDERAQDERAGVEQGQELAEDVELTPGQIDQILTEQLQLQWQPGPTEQKIGREAEVKLPAGYRYLDQAGTHRLLKAFENFPDDADLAMVSPSGSTEWFVVFSFDDIGYVKDDEKDDIDKQALYESFRAGAAAGNKQRAAQGMSSLELVGWAVEPYYNADSNSLEWGLKYRSDGDLVLNYFMKRLGRRGVMSCNLVVGPEEFEEVMPKFREVMKGFEFQSGKKYAEFQAGDKIAEYGLTALVAGGALAVAAKSGLLGKLWKVIVFGFLAAAGAIKKFFGGGESRSA